MQSLKNAIANQARDFQKGRGKPCMGKRLKLENWVYSDAMALAGSFMYGRHI